MFVPVPTILDFTRFNQKLFEACEKDAQRNHYVKNIPMETLFHEDLEAMHTLPNVPYEVFLLEPITCDNYAKIHFDGNTYSTSPKYARDEVYIKATSDYVIILNQKYEKVVIHPHLYGKGLESMDWLPYLELMLHRPGAIKYTSFIIIFLITGKNI